MDAKIKTANAIELYIKEYEERKMSAGYGGEHHDGGHRHAMLILNAFYAGIDYNEKGIFPDFLSNYIQEAENMEDPDYKKYLELKKKFKEN